MSLTIPLPIRDPVLQLSRLVCRWDAIGEFRRRPKFPTSDPPLFNLFCTDLRPPKNMTRNEIFERDQMPSTSVEVE